MKVPARGVAWVAAGGLCVLAAVSAWMQMQTRFMPYDDEGLVLYALKNFLGGRVLYDEVLTQYGPAYFFAHWLLLKPWGAVVTHDVVRAITAGCWLLGSAAMGIGVFRLTRDGWLACVAFLASFSLASFVTFEPGHPQAMLFVVLGIALITLSALSGYRAAALLGILGGILFSTKVNTGVLFAAGTGWALLAAAPNAPGDRALRALAGAGLIALPIALLRANLTHSTIALYAAIGVAAAVNVVVAGALHRPEQGARAWIPFTVAFLVTVGLILAVPLACGTSLGGLWTGVVGQHLGFDRVFLFPPDLVWRRLHLGFIVAGVCSGAAMAAMARTRWGHARLVNLFVASLKCAVAGVVLFSAMQRDQGRMTLPAMLLPWMWLAVVPFPVNARTSTTPLVRLALLSLATTLVLVAYPVAGSQQSWAILYLVPLACVLLADVPAHLGCGDRVRSWIGVGVLALVSWPLAVEGRVRWREFSEREPAMTLHGAKQLRLPEVDAAAYEALMWNVRVWGDALLTMPGMYSFNLWSQVESPTLLNQTNWPFAFDHATQIRIVAAAKAHPRAVAIRNDWVLRDSWQRGQPDPTGSLVEYLRDAFEPAFRLGNYEFLVPRAVTERPPLVGAWWVEDAAAPPSVRALLPGVTGDTSLVCISIPAIGGAIHALEFDPAVPLAPFAPGAEFAVVGADGVTELTKSALERDGLDATAARQIHVRLMRPEPNALSPTVRVLGPERALRLRLPFLTPSRPAE